MHTPAVWTHAHRSACIRCAGAHTCSLDNGRQRFWTAADRSACVHLAGAHKRTPKSGSARTLDISRLVSIHLFHRCAYMSWEQWSTRSLDISRPVSMRPVHRFTWTCYGNNGRLGCWTSAELIFQSRNLELESSSWTSAELVFQSQVQELESCSWTPAELVFQSQNQGLGENSTMFRSRTDQSTACKVELWFPKLIKP